MHCKKHSYKRKIREDSRRIPQEEDQRRQQAYSSRGRSEKTAGVFLKRKIREDNRCIPQEEDQRRQQAYSSRGRSEKTAGVFLKRKIREDSRRISQEEDQRRQQTNSFSCRRTMISKFLLASIVLGLLLVSVSVDGLPVEMRAKGPGKLVQDLADGELGCHDQLHNSPGKRSGLEQCEGYCFECTALEEITSCFKCLDCKGMDFLV